MVGFWVYLRNLGDSGGHFRILGVGSLFRWWWWWPVGGGGGRKWFLSYEYGGQGQVLWWSDG